MKICLINNLYAPYSRGGAEKVVAAIQQEYQQAGHEVFLITTKPKQPQLETRSEVRIFYFPSSFYNLGKKSLAWRLFWHINNLFSCTNYRRLRRILRQEKPELVITHNLMGLGFMAARAIKKSGASHHHFLHDIQLLHPSGLIIWGQENIVFSLPARLYQLITRFCLAKPDLVISPSRWLLAKHLKQGFFNGSPTEIRPLAPILTGLRDVSQDINKIGILEETVIEKSSEPKKLLFAGQIEKHKGIIFLLQAFQKFATTNSTLTIAGDGVLLNSLRQAYQKDGRIKFLGRLNKEELGAEMKKADALVMPSLCYENSPTVILEAQNAGLPVVASRLGGIPEIIGPRDRLFTPADEIDLFKQLNF